MTIRREPRAAADDPVGSPPAARAGASTRFDTSFHGTHQWRDGTRRERRDAADVDLAQHMPVGSIRLGCTEPGGVVCKDFAYGAAAR